LEPHDLQTRRAEPDTFGVITTAVAAPLPR
jgi:hypothetical protein